jgi:hypothetical protein
MCLIEQFHVSALNRSFFRLNCKICRDTIYNFKKIVTPYMENIFVVIPSVCPSYSKWHSFRDRNLYQIFVKFRANVFHNRSSKRQFFKIRLHDSQILPGAWNEFIHVIVVFIVRFEENFDSKRFFDMLSFGSFKFSEILCSENYTLLHEAIKPFPEISLFFI